jgi:hypothetical protein
MYIKSSPTITIIAFHKQENIYINTHLAALNIISIVPLTPDSVAVAWSCSSGNNGAFFAWIAVCWEVELTE